jgi:SAM-dependent methyltransferase
VVGATGGPRTEGRVVLFANQEIMEKVKTFYNRHREMEDRRLTDNALEMPVTLRYIEKYLSPGDRVLDIACGTGRYAEALLGKGYRLSVNDLSERNMALTLNRVKDHPRLEHVCVSDAMDSSIWVRESWDAVLLFGPLYHLREKEQRLELLRKAKHHTTGNGLVYSAFMSRTAALLFGIKHNPEGIMKKRGVQMFWDTGTDEHFIEDTGWFTQAYFSFPEEIEPMMRQVGLRQMHLVGIEGVFGERMELFHKLKRPLQDRWKQFVMDHCEEHHMVQSSKHLLSVSRC